MRRIGNITFLVISLCVHVLYANVFEGTSASAAAMARADAMTANSKEGLGAFANPALISLGKRYHISMMYAAISASPDLPFLNFSFSHTSNLPRLKSRFGCAASFELLKFNSLYSQSAAIISFSYLFNDIFAFGANVKNLNVAIREEGNLLSKTLYHSLSFDLGAAFMPLPFLSIALFIKDVYSLPFRSISGNADFASEKLKLDFRLGLSYRYKKYVETSIEYSLKKGVLFSFEYNPISILTLRYGTRVIIKDFDIDDTRRLEHSFGVGFNLSYISLDFGFRLTVYSAFAHAFSISFDF